MELAVNEMVDWSEEEKQRQRSDFADFYQRRDQKLRDDHHELLGEDGPEEDDNTDENGKAVRNSNTSKHPVVGWPWGKKT